MVLLQPTDWFETAACKSRASRRVNTRSLLSTAAIQDSKRSPSAPANPSQVSMTLATQATVAGTITDSSGNPIAGAEVYVQLSSNLQQGYSTTTAGDGTYSLLGIPAGTYDVTIFSQGFLADTQTAISAAAGQQATVNAALAACGTSIIGTVVDTGGNAVPQGQVEILDAAGHVIGQASIQDNGIFDVTSAQGVDLSAVVFAEGYAGARRYR